MGSIFRTADAVGIKKLYLCGHTPSPVDRFGRPNERLTKVALGAEHSVDFESTSSVLETIRELQRAGFRIIALEQQKGSSLLWTYDLSLKKKK